ncbi:hypothetical protein C7C56_001360 [Massilia glaciei]|uniref:Uncharacterized protein n=1 Tax=Massilia glaciei TaxID=1524097 RepID=A0A2U2I773_9BURK|nr:hypothetical protein C7C56_001360 [Massilia glaciei]
MNSQSNFSRNRFSYTSITQEFADQILQFMADAQRHNGLEARFRRERAYGAYMCWRALVRDEIDPAIFNDDDCRLEALLSLQSFGMQ